MRLILSLFLGVILVASLDARRVRYRPVQQEAEEAETIQYYTADPQEAQQQQSVVLVSAADQYNGLYGQPTASARHSQDNYIPQSRSTIKSSRVKEQSKAPPVQTIRNYNKVNDDGSFTFGYEAADGSFKEETRGTDCVVRGKYGYVDPDGNKREFTYVSGNPCDPNAPKEEDEEKLEEHSNEPENIPANYPTRPIRPIRPVTPIPKPAITLFQNNYDQQEEIEPEPEQLLKQHPTQSSRQRPLYLTRAQYAQESQQEYEAPVYQRQRLIPSSTPASVLYKQSVTPLNITPRPSLSSSTARSELPATTYRPQLLQVAVTPRPALLYTKTVPSPGRSTILPSTTASPLSVTRNSAGNIDFDAEFQKFQQENNIVSPTPSSLLKSSSKPNEGNNQIYSSELVYDPSSGQYNTQLYQTLPQTDGDFQLNQRIQPYVHQPQQQTYNLQQLQQQSPLYRNFRPQTNQALYQQQQAELQFQNSAHLFAQQQRARTQQQVPVQYQQQQQQQQQLQAQGSPQSYYFVQPSAGQQPQLTNGQIEQFLRGHNIQF